MDKRDWDGSAQLIDGEWVYTLTGLDMQGRETSFAGLSKDDLSQIRELIGDMLD